MAEFAASEKVWMERTLYDDMEVAFQAHLQKLKNGGESDFKPFQTKSEEADPISEKIKEIQGGLRISIAGEIAKAREHIRHTLNGLETDNVINKNNEAQRCYDNFIKKLTLIENNMLALTKRVESLEVAVCKCSNPAAKEEKIEVPPVVEEVKEEDEKIEDEEDFELFGSDEEQDEEAERVKQERLKAYEEKKSHKPQLVAKSNIILDVKPWDDETDMVELEKCVRSIEMDGLLWGASKLIPLAYGIKKLQIACVVEDDKVSTEDLEDKIVAFEDFVQSMDIAAFNKV